MRSCSIAEAAPSRAKLDFAVAGGRTRLLRQHVPYPFHVTQPFYLDPGQPGLATLYLQSASGGLYSGERLGLSVTAGEGVAVAVTTQSASIVHDCRGRPAIQATHLSLARDSLMIYAPDPLVLFPGAAIRTTLDVTLGPGSVALCQDGFACHDPKGADCCFDTISTETIVRAGGRVQVADRGLTRGRSLGGAASPLGPYRAAGSVLLLGMSLPDSQALQSGIDALGCLSGLSDLPNGAGTGIRLLAPDGGRLALGLALAFRVCFQAATGVFPAPRRK